MNYAEIIFKLIIIWGCIISIYKTHEYARENRDNIRKIMKYLVIDDTKEKEENKENS